MTKISTVTTLKAPLKVTLSFVRYHLNIGIDHMYLYFDDPTDTAISILADHERITVISCDEAYWHKIGAKPDKKVQDKQEANATNAFHLAQQAGIDWLIHLDSDELIYCKTSIKEYFRLVSQDVDVIRFPVMEATPQKLKYKNAFKEIKHFKVYTALPTQTKNFSTHHSYKKSQKFSARLWHQKIRLAKYLGSKSAAKQKFLHGHENGKSATRTSAPISKISCHTPMPKDGSNPTLIVSKSVFILHYDCMGFENWKSKWESRIFGDQSFATQRFSHYRITMREEIKNSFNNEKRLISLYRALYHLSGYELKLLIALRLIRVINFEDEIFEKGI